MAWHVNVGSISFIVMKEVREVSAAEDFNPTGFIAQFQRFTNAAALDACEDETCG